MTRKLLQITNEIVSGLHPSLHPDAVPLWIEGENVLEDDAALRPAPGNFLLALKLTLEAALGLIEAEVIATPPAIGRVKTIFKGTKSKLSRWDEGTASEVDVTRTAGGDYGVGRGTEATSSKPALRWSFNQLGDWVVGVNGHDIPQIYKATDAAPQKFKNLVLTGGGALPFSWAEIVRQISVFTIVLNTSNGGDIMEWADEDDIHAWGATQENSAGKLPIRNLNSSIVAAEDLGAAGLGVYGADQLHLASYVGPPEIIGARKLLDGVGAWGKSAIAAVGSVHYGWGPRGIFQTDGNSFAYLDSPSIRHYIEQNLNVAQASKIVAWPLIRFNSVAFFAPMFGDVWCNRALVWNWQRKTWWIWGFGRQAATAGKVLQDALVADHVGNIYEVSDSIGPTNEAVGVMPLKADAIITTGIGTVGMGEMGLGGYSKVEGA